MTKKLRVSFFLPDLRGGGAEKILSSLASELTKFEINVDFVLVNAVGVNLKNLSPEVNVIDLGAKNSYFSLLPLRQYLRQRRPDVMISALDLTNLIAILARQLSGVKLRLYIRIDNTISLQKRVRWKKKLEKLLLSFFYPQADGLIAVSQSAAKDIVEYANIPPELVHVIYNPVISPELLENSRLQTSHCWLQDKTQPVLLGVGRLNEQKDFSNLIKSFVILRQTVKAKLIILGEGEERTVLENLVKNLGVEDDVDMPGYVENPYSYMHQADVFVLSSRWEGLPTVLIEAMACGTPVVSTDCPSGPYEILKGGEYGHLVPTNSPSELANAMQASLGGDFRLPPTSWLHQFYVETITNSHLNLLGLR